MLEEAVPVKIEKPLASASDDNIRVNLDWVIVRDGPGTWAKKANWDEYLVRVVNRRETPIVITRLAIQDSTGYIQETTDDLDKLVQRSGKTARRYQDLGLQVEAGWGSASSTILLCSVVTLGGAGAVYSSMYSGAWMTGGGGAGAAAGLLLIGPAIVTAGVFQVLSKKRSPKK